MPFVFRKRVDSNTQVQTNETHLLMKNLKSFTSFILVVTCVCWMGCRNNTNPKRSEETNSTTNPPEVVEIERDGIQWERNSNGVTFGDIQAMAKKQDKIIFIGFHTKWSSLCSWMDKQVLSKKNVGDFYNARFVNFKVDADVGEGQALAKQFKVASFPTFLFVDADGNVLQSGDAMGFGDVEGMLILARQCLGELETKPWTWYQEEYQKGNRELAFLKMYRREQLRTHSIVPSNRLKREIFLATPEAERFVPESDTYNDVLWSAVPGNFFYEQLMNNRDAYSEHFDDRINRLRFVDQVLMRTMDYFDAGQTYDEDVVKQTLQKDFSDVYELAETANLIDRIRLSGNYDGYVISYVEWAEENDVPLKYSFAFPSSISRMTNLNTRYAKIGADLFRELIKESPDHFVSHVFFAYLTYKSGDEEAAFEYAEAQKEMTACFESSAMLEKFYNVMRILESKGDPTQEMQKPHRWEAIGLPEQIGMRN